MSAIDDISDEVYDSNILIQAVDDMFPCCTLCNDNAKWDDGKVCICVNGSDVGEIIYIKWNLSEELINDDKLQSYLIDSFNEFYSSYEMINPYKYINYIKWKEDEM